MKYFLDPRSEITQTEQGMIILIQNLHQSVNLIRIVVRPESLNNKSNFSGTDVLFVTFNSWQWA
jgi:hypothetical protein